MDAGFGWDGPVTLLAPVVSIGLALALRRVVPALVAGIAVASIVAARGDLLGGASASWSCFAQSACPDEVGAVAGVASYLGEAVVSWDNARVTFFTLVVACVVALLGVTGATQRLVHALEGLARGPRGAQVASWLAGLLVFFDDYASCLIVGGSMGPVCDRWGVSRAKLAYIVDSTSAPMASLALVGTWIGYEVGLLDQALVDAGQPAGGGYLLFVEGLPYRFYALYALALVGIVAWTGRDLGPMVHEERRARAHATHRAPLEAGSGLGVVAAAMPIVVLVAVTGATLVADGVAALTVPLAEARAFQVLEGADSYGAMVNGAIAALLVAVAVGFGSRTLTAATLVGALRQGAASVLGALAVLYCAWTLGNAIADTGARDFLVAVLGDWLPPALLPTVVFLVACGVSFATGTSFGTMSILVPLAVPLGLAMGGGPLLAMTAASVLAGACFGDHLSPVSDTTVLSAVGAGSDLVVHARTQLPYGLLAGAAAILLGTLPAGYGVPAWLLVPVALLAMTAVLRALGTPVDDATA